MHRSVAADAVDVGPPVSAGAGRADCDEVAGECLSARLDDAERRLADAYEQAAAARVRPRILRGYQREWDRARDEATEQPRAALRLYSMITSDLYGLAEDADARDDEGGR